MGFNSGCKWLITVQNLQSTQGQDPLTTLHPTLQHNLQTTQGQDPLTTLHPTLQHNLRLSL